MWMMSFGLFSGKNENKRWKKDKESKRANQHFSKGTQAPCSQCNAICDNLHWNPHSHEIRLKSSKTAIFKFHMRANQSEITHTHAQAHDVRYSITIHKFNAKSIVIVQDKTVVNQTHLGRLTERWSFEFLFVLLFDCAADVSPTTVSLFDDWQTELKKNLIK